MSYFCLEPTKDNFNQIAELQVCLAEALYDIESTLSDPGALPKEEARTLRDQDCLQPWSGRGRLRVGVRIS